MKKNYYTSAILLLLTSFFFSCGNNSIKDKINNDVAIQVESADEEMNLAIQKSISTFDEFDDAYNKNEPENESYAIKIAFPTPDNSFEHIWVSRLYKKDGDFYGVVNNTPNSTQQVNYGDTIKIDFDKMSDWMYLSNGVLKGGNTIRVIRNQLPESDKKEFDEALGFLIEE